MSTLLDHLQAKCYYYCRDLSVMDVFVVFLVLLFLNRKQGILYSLLLSFFETVIAAVTLLGRTGTTVNSISTIWYSFKVLLSDPISRQSIIFDMIFNVLLFVPIGALLCARYDIKHSMVIGSAISAIIEALQLITGRGIFEISDLLTNTLGVALGVFVYQTARLIKRSLLSNLKIIE